MAKKKIKSKEFQKPYVKASTEERHKRVWEALFYSHQQLDTLLIAISGGGIYVCLETIKYYSEHQLQLHILIKISAVLLLSAVISNFFSQWSASKVHKYDYCINDIEIMCQEDCVDRANYIEEIKNHECKASIYNKLNSFLSISSIILMSAGLVGIIVFFTAIF